MFKRFKKKTFKNGDSNLSVLSREDDALTTRPELLVIEISLKIEMNKLKLNFKRSSLSKFIRLANNRN
jgi:hypothetical protein